MPGLALLGWRAWRRAGNEPGSAPGVSRRERGYLGAFVDGCRRRGMRLTPGTTLREMVARLEDAPCFAGELVRYHYGVSYEGRERDEGFERELRQRAGRWAAGSG